MSVFGYRLSRNSLSLYFGEEREVPVCVWGLGTIQGVTTCNLAILDQTPTSTWWSPKSKRAPFFYYICLYPRARLLLIQQREDYGG
jgi:hypothetical protein